MRFLRTRELCSTLSADRQAGEAMTNSPFFFYFYTMQSNSSNNPLHGITLQRIVGQLEAFYGFDTLGELINIKCFTTNPSIKSSLTFLRKTDWARKKVEELYVRTLPKINN
jgi:uncharacterized protein (DUF2132 family)